MKIVIPIVFLFNCLTTGQAQAQVETTSLDGYFIVSSFDTTFSSGCNLNFETTTTRYGNGGLCGDGNIYKNVATISFIDSEYVDEEKIHDLLYYSNLQKHEHFVYICTNPLILLEAEGADSTILHQTILTQGVRNNQQTAELVQEHIMRLHLNYAKQKSYIILMKGSLQVLVLNKRQKPKTFKDPYGLNQYLIIQHDSNHLQPLKTIW